MYLMKANPPYIRFKTVATKRLKPAEEGGAIYYVDQDWALVTSHGSKDTVEKEVPQWFTHLKDEVRQGRLPGEWLKAYEESYGNWKAGKEMPVIGTPIRNWPVLSPAEVEMLTDLKICAVEDLANANEELLARIGMGARALKQKAQDWVTSNTDQAPLVQQLEALRASVAGLTATVSAQKETIAALSAVRPAEVETVIRREAASDPGPAGPSDEDLIEDAIAEA